MFFGHMLVTTTLFLLLPFVFSRITNVFTPIKYVLEIKTELEQKSYSGEVVITGKCEIPSDTIKLNAIRSKLSIDELKVLVHTRVQSTNIVERSYWDEERDIFTIKIKSLMVYGQIYVITIPFEGKLGQGVQDGYFILDDGEGFIAASRFNNFQASSAFPCFDENFFKGYFRVILHRKENEKSLSSMPLEKTTDTPGKPGWKTDEYKMTEIELLPHLILFAVTNIPLSSTPDCEKRIKYWYKKNSKISEEAGKVACKKTEEMSTMLAKTYGLPPLEASVSKIDVFLHPLFPYSEVGGWGLIFSRENSHMKDVWDLSDKFVTFERLVFQYFGGMVAYDSISSAQFFQTLVVYVAETLLDERKDYSYVAQNLLTIDGPMLTNQFVGEFDPQYYKWKTTAHNVYVPWDSDHYRYYRESIGTIFIRMIHQSVGNTYFQNALREFVKKYKNKHASEAEFWTTLNSMAKPAYEKMYSPLSKNLEKSSWLKNTQRLPNWSKNLIGQVFAFRTDFANLPFGVSVNGIAKTWIDEIFTGNADDKQIVFEYPMIRVQRYDQITLLVTQEPFQGNWLKNKEIRLKEDQKVENMETKSKEVNGDKKKEINSKEADKLWWIPLTYTTANRPDFNKMEPTGWAVNVGNTKQVRLYAKTRQGDWIIFNNKCVGLYRVMYEVDNWLLIIKALNEESEMKKIDYLNRMQLVRDALDFGFLGELQYDLVFRLISYLPKEDNTFVWTVFFHHIRNLESAIRKSDYYDEYQTSMKKLLTKIYTKTFQNNDWSHIYKTPLSVDHERNEARFKLLVLNRSTTSGVEEFIRLCRAEVDKWKAEGNIPQVYNWFQKELVTVALSAALSNGNNDDFEFVFNKLIGSSENDDNLGIYVAAFQNIQNQEYINTVLNWVFSKNSENVINKKSEFVRILTAQPKSSSLVLDYLVNNVDNIKMNTKDEEFTKIFRTIALESNTVELNKLKDLVDKTDLKSNQEILKIIEQGTIGDRRRQEWLNDNKISLERGLNTWKYDGKE